MNPEIGDAGQEGTLGKVSLTQRALIHVGANAVSMIIVEADDDKKANMEVLELLEQPLPLAEDIFRDGNLSRATIERCVKILHRFESTFDEYGLHGDQIEGVATNLLFEADNSELLLNRLQVACGIDVRPLDDGDMTRLVYLSVTRILREQVDLKKARVLAVHVGPGNTRLMLFKKGRIVQYNSYRMGAHRVAEAMERMAPDAESLFSLVKGHVNGTTEQIEEAYANEPIDALLAIGPEIQAVAEKLSDKGTLVQLDRKALRKLAKNLSQAGTKELAATYELNVHAARPLLTGLVCNLAVLGKFDLTKMHIPRGRFEERFLIGLVGREVTAKRFVTEVIDSARDLAKKYLADAEHGRHVASLAVKLFDEVIGLTGLSTPDRLLLEVASIVHEVGSFISRRSHHKHSLYIIKNSEIFGLNDKETTLVALVARYHRHALPEPGHPFMRDLTRESRVRVSKLAAILRVADALDRSHAQHLEILGACVVKDQLLLQVGDVLNVSVEELALRSKGDLFEQVFGLEVVLETS